MKARIPILLLVALSAACAQSEPQTEETESPELTSASPGLKAPSGEAIVSLLGQPLEPPALSEEFRVLQEGLLREARARLDEAPDEPESWIWVGRRTAYLARYGEAIDVYTEAIERFPEEPRLYRHRGHRWITTRQLDRAIEDLSRAADLIEGRPDRVEPDGLPNDRGIPTSTLQSNIWYHLGLAHTLRGDFESALAAYEECLAVSGNPDMLVATSYWLYLTQRRLGMDAEAAATLESITPELEIIENADYHRLLLTYRRLADAHELWEEAGADPAAVRYATVAYGLGAYHLTDGRPEDAREWFERAVESPTWAAFGYLAAEAELARWND